MRSPKTARDYFEYLVSKAEREKYLSTRCQGCAGRGRQLDIEASVKGEIRYEDCPVCGGSGEKEQR